jgi:hypothetical protein
MALIPMDEALASSRGSLDETLVGFHETEKVEIRTFDLELEEGSSRPCVTMEE